MKLDTQHLYNGVEIPAVISTRERIFRVKTFDGEMVLCNLAIAQNLIKSGYCYKLWHYWNHSFETIGKKDVLEMPL